MEILWGEELGSKIKTMLESGKLDKILRVRGPFGMISVANNEASQKANVKYNKFLNSCQTLSPLIMLLKVKRFLTVQKFKLDLTQLTSPSTMTPVI